MVAFTQWLAVIFSLRNIGRGFLVVANLSSPSRIVQIRLQKPLGH
jgi:hypothetical protein